MTELIVALDGPEPWRLADALERDGFKWFKIGPQAMACGGWDDLVKRARRGLRLFIDLKLSDTDDTCRGTVARFAEAGIAAVSTFTESATAAALRGAEQSPLQVWQVYWLTDKRQAHKAALAGDGIICPVVVAYAQFCNATTTICPGIRFQNEVSDGHLAASTPEAARHAKVSFAVVGRPIWQADDPIAAAYKFANALGDTGAIR